MAVISGSRGPRCGVHPMTPNLRIACFAYARPPTYANLFIDYYHVKCFEELLDLSSSHYAERFEPDRWKHIPDHGAQCILEEYLSRWKHRAEQNHKRQEESQSSSGSECVIAEGSSAQVQPPTADENANTMGLQLPSQNVSAEPAPPGPISVVPNENPTQTTSVPGTAIQPLAASKKLVEPDEWSIADTVWSQVRQAEAEASKEHDRLWSKSCFRSIADDYNSTSLHDRCRSSRTFLDGQDSR